jgi:hypothetical protein
MNTPGLRLKAARERCGFASAKDAALAMDVPIATYTQHEKAVRHLPARRADEYAAFFKVTPEYLLYGRGDVPDRVPILDTYGAETGRTAALPAKPSELTRALASDGIAIFGMVAIYNEPQGGRPAPDCHGRLCVVAFEKDGGVRQVVRLVQRGTRPDRYHLIGAPLPDIDQPVLWIAPVVALVPA